MPVFVRIPRRPFVGYKWNKYQVVHTWETGTCYFINSNYYMYDWNKYEDIATFAYIWFKYSLADSYTWNTYAVGYKWNRTQLQANYYYDLYAAPNGEKTDEWVGSEYLTDPDHEGYWGGTSYYVRDPSKDYYVPIAQLDPITSLDRNAYPDSDRQWDSSLNTYVSYSYVGTSNSGWSKEPGTVSSTDSNAYPQDGEQDGTWYLYVGTDAQVKGEYIEAVEGDSLDSYPSNGIQDGYWYEFYDTSVNHAKGDFIEVVSSTESNTYSDGFDGMYWFEPLEPRVVISSESHWWYPEDNVTTVTSTDINAYPHTFEEYEVNEVGSSPSETYYIYKGKDAGELLGTVTSESSDTYPENGEHTDGYWYIKIT